MSLTLRQILTTAYTETGLISEAQPVMSAYQAQVGVKAFNAMCRAEYGKRIGQPLHRDWTAVAGATACPGGLYAVNVKTPANPDPGTRIGVVGARTVTATDGTIEEATTTAGGSWFYRDDTATWVREKELTLDQEHPFCEAMNEALPYMVALRLLNGFEPTQTILTGAAQGQRQLRELYGDKRPARVDTALLRTLNRCS